MKWEKFGPLSAVVKPCSEPDAVVVLCHGYGADARDLVSLSDYVAVDKDIYWIFPEAPIDISLSLGVAGRAWFEIDAEALELALRQGRHRDYTHERPLQMDSSRELLAEMLEKLPFSIEDIILGGFSQGAMITTDYTFQSVQKPKALVTLSGVLLDQKQWSQKAVSCEGVPYFQSHGNKDTILALSGAHQLHQLYKKSGMKGKFYEFIGGHEIPLPILNHLSTFIENV